MIEGKRVLTVAHLINPYLPRTQGWMHNEISFNREYRHLVLCRYTTNNSLFPLDNVYPAFPKYGPIAALSMILARIRQKYPPGHNLRVIGRHSVNVLHAHFAFEAWRNMSFIRRSGLPLVTTFYGLDVDKLARRRSCRKRYRAVFATGRVFIAEGPYMASRLESIGCPPDRIRVVYQAADVERVRRHLAPKDPSRVRVLFVGLSRLKKGAEDAARAFCRAAAGQPRLELHLVGDGRYRALTQRIFRQAGMSGRVVYHGYVDVDSYLRLLGSSDVLLASSITDPNGDSEGGAPVCVTEALVAGVPVVGTTHCDIPSVVQSGETGLLCAERDVESLAANLARLAGDGELRLRMGRRAYESSSGRLGIQRRVEEINEIYRMVTS